jgi:hypothetical protein
VRRNYLLWLCLLWQCADYFSALWLVLWCCVVAAYLNLEEGGKQRVEAGLSPKEGTPPRAGLRSIRCRSQLTTLLVLTALAAVGFAANPSLTLAPTLTLTLT